MDWAEDQFAKPLGLPGLHCLGFWGLEGLLRVRVSGLQRHWVLGGRASELRQRLAMGT